MMRPAATNLSRQAFTLFELLLVLAVLVALAGIAVPTFESMVSSRRLQQSIEQLRNHLTEARVAAMRTGQAQVLRATLQTRDYSISPWLGGNEDQDASAGATVATSDGQIMKTESVQGSGVGATTAETTGDIKQLMEGVQFAAVETLLDSRNALDLQKSGESSSTGTSGLSTPVLFYPDGSTTTAQVILVDEKGRRMAVQIRGVTGQLSMVRLTSVNPGSVAAAP